MAMDIVARGMAASIKSEVEEILTGLSDPIIVAKLPTASEETRKKLYLVGPKGTAPNIYHEEYITVKTGSTYMWEAIGSTDIDVSKYVTKEEFNNLGFALDENDPTCLVLKKS